MRSASPAPMGTPGIIHDASYVSDISVTAEELIIWRLSWSKTLAAHPCFSSPHPLPLHFQTLAFFHLSRSPTTTLFYPSFITMRLNAIMFQAAALTIAASPAFANSHGSKKRMAHIKVPRGNTTGLVPSLIKGVVDAAGDPIVATVFETAQAPQQSIASLPHFFRRAPVLIFVRNRSTLMLLDLGPEATRAIVPKW